MSTKETVIFYRNGHYSTLPPTFRALQFLMGAEEKALAAAAGGERLPRPQWAFTSGGGFIQGLAEGETDSSFAFLNPSAEHDALLSAHRTQNYGDPAREFFFEEYVDHGRWTVGLLHKGKAVVCGPKGNTGVQAVLVEDPERCDVRRRKFTYDGGLFTLEETAESIAAVSRVYAGAGWSRERIIEEIAVPVLEACTANSGQWGFNAISGTVVVPGGALAGAGPLPDGRLSVPLLLNVPYDPEPQGENSEEDYFYYCCRVDSIDRDRILPNGDYLLLVCEVVEGPDLEGGAPDFDFQLASEIAEMLEPLAGSEAPGDDAEAAAELALRLAEGTDSRFDACSLMSPAFAAGMAAHAGKTKGWDKERTARAERALRMARSAIIRKAAEKAVPE